LGFGGRSPAHGRGTWDWLRRWFRKTTKPESTRR
jgi:hypothetical protein